MTRRADRAIRVDSVGRDVDEVLTAIEAKASMMTKPLRFDDEAAEELAMATD